MFSNVNISIGLAVFMGIAAGGLLSLVLIAPRRQQISFSIMFALTLLMAILGALGAASVSANITSGIVSGVVMMVLSVALGYVLTTYSVLSRGSGSPDAPRSLAQSESVAVVLLAQGEPPHYEVKSAGMRFERVDDREDLPLPLLRPFYMRDLKGKYHAIGSSPSRDRYLELAAGVQSRLDTRHRVYSAFYSDAPMYAQVVSNALEDGARHIIVANLRVTDPPDVILTGEILDDLPLASLKATVTYTQPLYDGALLPQIYVRRLVEVTPQAPDEAERMGVLIVGRGHPATGGTSARRMEQETEFLERVRSALVKVGFSERRVLTCWLRYGSPSIPEALAALIAERCYPICWAPASFVVDGVNTLYDIPAQLGGAAERAGVRLIGLGAWNADDLAAQEIASRVRAITRAPAPVR